MKPTRTKKDGRFFAEGNSVFRRPLARGDATTMGYRVLETAPGLSGGAAVEIAHALNFALDYGELE